MSCSDPHSETAFTPHPRIEGSELQDSTTIERLSIPDRIPIAITVRIGPDKRAFSPVATVVGHTASQLSVAVSLHPSEKPPHT